MERKRCYGCMNLKQQSPVCEHCGFSEENQNLPHQLPMGTLLRGHYLVGKVLGQGGFGITYLGWDNNLEMPVAIKEYYPSSYVNRDCTQSRSVTGAAGERAALFENNKQRFLREAKTLAKLRDIPQIVQVLNFFEENNTAYIIMEYIRGMDLRRYVNQKGRLSVQETFSILRPVMEALSEVHKAGLVHRDITPDNIMLLPRGGAKLLDFGAVRDVGDADINEDLQKSTMAILKQGFAPLEQYRSRGNLGPWTDVYALCATIYYCLTGRVPMDAPERMLAEADIDWSSVPGLTGAQSAALHKGMALMPKDRFTSVEKLCTELFGEELPISQWETQPMRAFDIPQPASQTPQTPYSYTLPLEEPQPVPYTAPVERQIPYTAPVEPVNQDTFPAPSAQPEETTSEPEEKKTNSGKKWILVAAAAVAVLILAFFNVHIWSEGTCAEASTCLLCGKVNEQANVEHTFADATCTESRTCTVCGKQEGYPLGHKWIDATCTEAKTCQQCGKVDGEALGHDWLDATCAAPKTCSRCEKTEGETLQHTFAEATCTAPKTCTVCGATEGTASGHDWIEATYDTPKTCAVCGETEGEVKGYVGDVGGSWPGEKFYRSNRYTGYYLLNTRLENCRRFTLNYRIGSISYGNIYGNFEVFVRYGEKEWEWKSLGKFKLEEGEDFISVDFSLDPGVSFDAVAVVCQASGNYSYSSGMSITEVQLYED